ncbi:MAG TPA: polysaccharide lyase family protein [Verrucomicrobiae bacterium]|nr:polysaccharide lyase family protein [Verrucomicrobiae bacterium]
MSATRIIPFFLTLVVLTRADFAGAAAPVILSQDDATFTLANGIVTAQVSKHSGDLVSLKYRNRGLLEAGSGHPFGYWSQDTSHGQRTARITIDPQTNGGERGEVSVKSAYVPEAAGSGSGFRGFSRSPACDIEIRYTLDRGLSGLYAYAIFTHKTNDPATGIGEARFAAKLNPEIFNYLNVDANRRRVMPTPAEWLAGTELNFPEARRLNTGLYRGQAEHKYDYSADQFDTRAYGWLGTQSHLGFWFINPSVEYLSGGPTKYELTGHLDISDEAAPVLLNYWRSSHYGGAVCFITNGEAWTKVVGPFLIYCNSGPTPDALWQDALARAAQEQAAWPYGWVEGVDYPHKVRRATVSGRLVMHDPQAPGLVLSNLLVGLTAPDYLPPTIPRGRGGFGGFGFGGGGEDETTHQPGADVAHTPPGNAENSVTSRNAGRRFRGRPFGGFQFGPRLVTWQTDAKHYEFWVRGDASGRFTIPNVDAGTYSLHAIADGVLGEFTVTNLTVAAGETLDLGNLNWRPVRYGKQLWDIGIPNRSAAEFFKGDDYYHWGWYLQYPRLFPQGVNYVIGRSDFHRDWFFEQVPHNADPNNTTGRGRGRSTTWTITFHLPKAPHGRAMLRLAICGSSTRTITVTVNGRPAGVVPAPPYNATINRDGIAGTWTESDLPFDASLMRSGTNVMGLTIPAGPLTSGIMYDYLRLELEESAASPESVP